MQENIFDPLGMHYTHFNDDVTLAIKNRVTDYKPVDSTILQETKKAGYYLRPIRSYAHAHRNAPHYGGSGLFTTIEDWHL
jgi:CubicO group peptidase (beta-lactamase class C family)